ncbi:MAG TPA: helix-hairpin-helix domain-containing protein [Bryobacteraceae bacterium]|nr:helix-hairpin-helix domain-containing protein [Bryobacteraceae bacterium]
MKPYSALALYLAIFLVSLRGGPALAARPPKPAKATSTPVRRDLIDINHATIDELKTLPGIQDALAAKIVKNRPYANKTQLSSKGVVSAATYKRIRTLVIAKQ